MPLQSETIANWIAGTPSADIIRLHVARALNGAHHIRSGEAGSYTGASRS